MIDDDLQATAAAYVLGALEPDEERAFEAQLARSSDLRALVDELRDTSALLASGAPPAVARPELRERVLAAARVAGMPPIALAPRRRERMAALAWAAAITALVVAGVQTVRLQRRATDLRTLAATLDSASRRRDVLAERLAAILDGHTVMSVLQPTGSDVPRRFGAQVFWRRDQQTWLVHVYDMPALPPGSVYQLWYVTADAKISAGVFDVDSTGHGVAVLHVPPQARNATVAAMSVEPGPRGSAQPTGPIVLAGSVRAE